MIQKLRVEPLHYEIGQGGSSHPECPKALYCVAYFEGLFVSAIKDRFEQSGYLMYKNLLEILCTWTGLQ